MPRSSAILRRSAALRSVWVPLAIVALAAGLRLWALHTAPDDPFYDAAVRSMGLSWHNFFFGALEPAGGVAVDKVPVDLWLQVAAVKVLGFNSTALHLPAALGGTAAVALLYAAVGSVAGRLAASLSALALAVLPLSVVTSRSDTMDSVMMAVLVGALWASTRALQTRRGAWVLLAAGLVGLAFNVKLAEALIPLPALALMWWGAPRPGRRVAVLAGAAAVLVAVGMSWIVTASFTPKADRPYPIGSRDGSIYNVVFVYNGLDRLRGTTAQPLNTASSGRPDALRLLRPSPAPYGPQLGLELVAGMLLLLAAVLAGALRFAGGGGAWRAQPRVARWFAVSIGVWLGTTVVLFSVIHGLQARYVETMSPAVAALVGVGAAALVERALQRRVALALAGALALGAAFAVWIEHVDAGRTVAFMVAGLAALIALTLTPLGRRAAPWARGSLVAAAASVVLFAAPVAVSLGLIERNIGDAALTGSGAQYSDYLRAHRAGARYEVASSDVLHVAALIVRDAQPVLILNDIHGILVGTARLQQLVRNRQVRFIIITNPCTSAAYCPGTIEWSLRSTVEVRPGLYEYVPPAAPGRAIAQ